MLVDGRSFTAWKVAVQLSLVELLLAYQVLRFGRGVQGPTPSSCCRLPTATCSFSRASLASLIVRMDQFGPARIDTVVRQQF